MNGVEEADAMLPLRQPCEDGRRGSPEPGVVGTMSHCDQQLTQHRFARPRSRHIPGVPDPLSVNTDPEPSLCVAAAKADPSLHGASPHTAAIRRPLTT